MPAAVEFMDIAGLVRGASKGEGLGNKFLQHIREVDAIIEVVRCFEDKDVSARKPSPSRRRSSRSWRSFPPKKSATTSRTWAWRSRESAT